MLARKAEGTRISRPRMALNTLKGIHKEMARVYRQSLAGNLPSGEMTRLIFGLRELRQTVEAQNEAAVINGDVSLPKIEFVILAVPPGTQCDPHDNHKFIWPDGTPCTASTEFTPYEPTPNWTALPPPAPELSIMNAADVTPVEVFVDDGKVTRLHPHQRQHSSNNDPPGAA
jgi:hypothetical protein